MIFGLFILTVALSISAVAAYYSIAGLTAIFAAAVVPIIIMGAVLEVGKIAATVWLHKFWHRAALQFKLYLVPAILVLMLITSMGIFGYLSKAHMDQNITVGDSAAQVAILDEKIKTEQDNITASKRALQQMDAQVDQMLGRTTDDRGANRAVQIRKNQAKERKSLQADITAAQKTISQLQAERAPKAAESRKIEAEVGPIRYIAALIYGDNPNADLLERAVRWVIILLVFVFDPLALILILAAEQTLIWNREDKRKKENEPAYESDDGQLTDEEYEKIKQEANVDDINMTKKLFDTEEEFFAHGKEIAREFDANEDRLPDGYASTQSYLNNPVSWISRQTDEGLVPKTEESVDTVNKHEYLNKPWVWMKNSEGPEGYVTPVKQEPIFITRISNPESNLDLATVPVDQTNEDLDNAIGLIAELQAKLDVLQAEHDAKHDELEGIKSTVITDHLGNPINVVFPTTRPKLDQVMAPDLSINAELSGNSVNAGFGTVFPKTPTKGDLYLRVDYLPSKLYKWNEAKWIEIDKTTTDVYSYDTEYIKHLTNKIASGEYDVELLTLAEQEQIQRYVTENPQS